MPNDPVDKDSQESLACYPQRIFYPISDDLSLQHRRITISYFRTCLIRQSYSQANLAITLSWVQHFVLEFTFEQLRYLLGAGRPSQTTKHTTSLFFFIILNINYNI